MTGLEVKRISGTRAAPLSDVPPAKAAVLSALQIVMRVKQ